ncbi:MAG: PEP-CTERM sorting domain-containing protein [Rubrivivax sp.]|nr:PEP-CTERM sorting domain-containing protein [Rubrivivax sp.]
MIKVTCINASFSARKLLGAAAIAIAFVPMTSQAAVILAGNATGNIATALTTLGISFTNAGSSMPGSLGASDTLILSFDGGGGPYINYTSALNSGADIIAFGGSCDGAGGFAAWVGQYINNTYTCWHLDGGDGKWNKLASNAATQYLPASFNPADNSMTYHMLHLLATTNTVMLGSNDEGNNIAAFRTYANGGSFNYLAMDPGPYGTAADRNNFTVPYLRGALLAAQSGIGGNVIPEPGSLALVGLGLLALRAGRRSKA